MRKTWQQSRVQEPALSTTLRSMVRRALFGLSMLIGVAAAQSSATWTFSSPRTAPDVEWSPSGNYVALSTNSGVYVFNSSFRLKWTKTTGGALPSFPNYSHPDRVHFSADSSSVWVRTGANGTFTEFSTDTGAVLRTHTFSDWDGDYALTPMTDALVAVKITVSAGVETIKIRSYNKSTLDPILTGTTFTHPYVAGADKPTVRFMNADYVGFYNRIINVTTGASSNWDNGTAMTEVWTLGSDMTNSLVQATMKNDGAGNYTQQSIRYQKNLVSTAWTSTNIQILGPLSLHFSTPNWLGFSSNGTQLSVFDSRLGNQLYTTDLGNTGGTMKFSPTAINTTNSLLTTLTDSNGVQKLAYLGLGTTATPTVKNAPIAGISGVVNIASGTSLPTAAGNANYVTQILPANGAIKWSNLSTAPTSEIAVSGTNGAAVTTNGVTFFNITTGAAIYNWAGSYKHIAWVNSSQAIAVKTDGSADLINFDGTTATLADTITSTVFGDGVCVLSNGAYAIGLSNNALKLSSVNLSTKTATSQSFSIPIKSAVPLDNGQLQVAFFSPSNAQSAWRRYSVSTTDGSFVAASSGNSNISSPYTVAPGYGYAASSTNSANNAVWAMFFSTGVGLDGTPTSELRLVRASDGKVLGSWANTFSYVRQLQFTPAGDFLFVGTGGSSVDGVVTPDDSGPQDMMSFNVPTWIASIVVPNINSGATGTGTINLAHPGITSVALTIDPAGPTMPATVTPTASASAANFAVVCPAVATDTTYTITGKASGLDETITTTFKVLAPKPSTVTIAPTSVIGGNSTTGTVTLTGIAPTGDTVVSLTSSAPNVASVPATVTVPAGSKTATFPISTVPVSGGVAYTVKATVGNASATSGNAGVNATLPASVTFDSNVLVSGNTGTGTVTLSTVAPTGGTVVKLASTNTSTATVPATITVPEGQKTATFPITTIAKPTDATVRFTAQTLGATVATSQMLTVVATLPSSVNLSAPSVVAGNTTTATVTLTTVAPTGGTVVHLSTGSANISIPATITVPAGSTTSNPFTITTYAVSSDTSASITATTLGATSASATLSLTSTPVTSVSFSPATVIAGTGSTGTVTIGGVAGPSGRLVTLATTGAVGPTTVTIPSGQSSATFAVTTSVSTSSSTATSTATLGSSSKSGNLSITPTTVTSFTLDNPSVTGGTAITGKITISGTALSGGFNVTLATSNSSVVSVGGGVTSTTVTIPAGSNSATVTLQTSPVGTTTNVNLTATAPNTSGVVAVATVVPPKVVSIVFNPASVTGGTQASFTITLNGPAPAGFGVSVSSNDSHLVFPNGTLKFSTGLTSQSYTANTTTVTTATTATATASAGGGSSTGTLTINPAS